MSTTSERRPPSRRTVPTVLAMLKEEGPCKLAAIVKRLKEHSRFEIRKALEAAMDAGLVDHPAWGVYSLHDVNNSKDTNPEEGIPESGTVQPLQDCYSKRRKRCGVKRRRRSCGRKKRRTCGVKRRKRRSCGMKRRRKRSCGRKKRRRRSCRPKRRRRSCRPKRRRRSCGRKRRKRSCGMKRRKRSCGNRRRRKSCGGRRRAVTDKPESSSPCMFSKR